MTLVTRSSLIAIYDMLVCLPPMDGWKLPPSKKIEFRARDLADVHALHRPWTEIVNTRSGNRCVVFHRAP